MKKLLIVYNTCGISGRENIEYYLESLESILNQDFDDFEIVVSSCLNSKLTIDILKSTFKNKISINWIKEKVPVNVSFNKTVLDSIKRFGEFEGYLYIDSGCNFNNDRQLFKKMYNLFKSGQYGMVSARTNTDTGYNIWFNIGNHDNDVESHDKFFNENGNFIIPLGKAVNLHVQIFSNSLVKAYGKPYTDIFAGQCSESVFSFKNAAIKEKWIVLADSKVEHNIGMDVASVGFLPFLWKQKTNRPTWDHPFIIPSIIDRINDGIKYGLGYEELQSIVLHDKSKFDENGYSISDNLKNYIKENLFLKKEEFDYNDIDSEWE